jgi:tetratricopeptide (TPR) repeat protein
MGSVSESPRPTIGIAILARDEEKILPDLLASIDGAFDRAVLLDTGSEDDTVGVFQRWAKTQAGMTFSVATTEWKGDFAYHRTQADMLLMFGTVDGPSVGDRVMVDWTCWADCDDTITAPEVLRTLAAEAPMEVGAYVFGYDYAQHPETGVTLCHLRRERLVRAGAGTWLGRVHEAQTVNGQLQLVDDGVCQWRHNKLVQGPEAAQRSNSRNLEILMQWVAEEPENSRVLAYVGTELAVSGKHDEAIPFYQRYLQLQTNWDEERAQVHRKLAASHIELGELGEAQRSALVALTVMPSWPDSYLILGQVAMARNEYDKAIEWFQQVIARGIPHTMLIINPLDYTFWPRKMIAGCLGAMSRFDEAIAMAEEAMSIDPGDEVLRHSWAAWKQQAKREHTAKTYVMAAQQLVAHDEQLKALTLLEECVPHFAIDHPDVVAIRSWVRERTAWATSDMDVAEFYKDASRPEDFHDDETCDLIASQLPRVGFLIDGLVEQGAERSGKITAAAA